MPVARNNVITITTNRGNLLFSSNLVSYSASLGILRVLCVKRLYTASRTQVVLRSRSRITIRTRISAAAIE
jgi:hypothetical protein